MESIEIQRELKRRGVTQREIAKKLEVTEPAISFVIHRKSVSNRIMKEISKAVGEDPRLVFPEYYLRSKRRRLAA